MAGHLIDTSRHLSGACNKFFGGAVCTSASILVGGLVTIEMFSTCAPWCTFGETRAHQSSGLFF